MKRHSFILLEVLVSFSLLAMVLGTLFYSYFQVSKDKKERELFLRPILEERYCAIFLERVLPRIKKDIFFSRDGELIFVFDHGTRKEPLLSDGVLGCLYHDKSKAALCLTIWPHTKFNQKEPSFTYTLLTDVDDVNLEFYYPNVSQKQVDPPKVTTVAPMTGWQSDWKKEYEALPIFMNVKIKRQGRDLHLAYSLEQAKMPIIFGRS